MYRTIIWVLCFAVYCAYGLECLHCRYIAVHDSVTSFIREPLNLLTNQLTTPDCAYAKEVGPGITIKECTGIPKTDQVNRCGTLSGTQMVSVAFIGAPIQVLIRGCFLVDKTTYDGCYSDKRILDQQQEILANTFESANTLSLGTFTGELCFNTTYNASKKTRYSIGIILVVFFEMFL